MLSATGQPLGNQLLDELARSAQGLSMERIRRVLTRAIAARGQLETEDVELILEEKRQSIRQTQILDFYPATEQISDIGGLDNLKDWLLRRGGAFSERARAYGLPNPRGLLLVGNSGYGEISHSKSDRTSLAFTPTTPRCRAFICWFGRRIRISHQTDD